MTGVEPAEQRAGEAEAIEIGVSVLKRLPILDSVRPDAEAVIAAAYPVIEAAVRADERQRIAGRIKAVQAKFVQPMVATTIYTNYPVSALSWSEAQSAIEMVRRGVSGEETTQ